jgi:hypothetical protein
MKNITKLCCVALLGTCFVGCTDNFNDYNTNHYAIYQADPPVLMPEMIEPMMFVQQNSSQLIDQMVGALGGYMTCSNRWGGQNFDTFNASEGWNSQTFNKSYNKLVNLYSIETATKRSGHYWAMASLLKAAVLMRVCDCYGPIPYSSIANGKYHTSYESVEDVYKHIIEDLTASANVLSQYAAQYPSSHPLEGNDLVYNGDYAKWAKLANSLALRAAVRIGNKEAAEQICASSIGVIESNNDNALVNPGVQGNPYQLAATGWGDLRVSSSIADYMNGYEDPRREKYFTKSAFDGVSYIGMRTGEASFVKDNVSKYSLPNFQTSSPLPICLASEVAFLKAECALRGWQVGENAQVWYEKGIRLSMEQYGIDANAIAQYIENNSLTPQSHSNDPRGSKYNYHRNTTVKIKWDADGSEKNLERIITQKWIAMYPMGLEAWSEYRRTGFPELAPSIDNLNERVITNTSRGMRRLRYPDTERDLNKENYLKGVEMLKGADNEATDLPWAKKN